MVIMQGEEKFYRSVRFWVATIAPVTAALISAYSDGLPWLKGLDQAELNTWIAGLILTAISYIAGRTYRNVSISGGLAKVREGGRGPIPGRVVGVQIVKARPEDVDGGGPKEPFYLSKRFYTALITPIIAAGLGALVKVLPEAAALDPSTVSMVIGAAFAAGIAYILARSARNTSIGAN